MPSSGTPRGPQPASLELAGRLRGICPARVLRGLASPALFPQEPALAYKCGGGDAASQPRHEIFDRRGGGLRHAVCDKNLGRRAHDRSRRRSDSRLVWTLSLSDSCGHGARAACGEMRRQRERTNFLKQGGCMAGHSRAVQHAPTCTWYLCVYMCAARHLPLSLACVRSSTRRCLRARAGLLGDAAGRRGRPPAAASRPSAGAPRPRRSAAGRPSPALECSNVGSVARGSLALYLSLKAFAFSVWLHYIATQHASTYSSALAAPGAGRAPPAPPPGRSASYITIQIPCPYHPSPYQ